ncbi:hypothetical protein F5X99DRAFT_374204 [Biscogniauxia marginata]|nr:hypothetical protein F5X99DRAFT_374204 [Biscogniauxia marginata]
MSTPRAIKPLLGAGSRFLVDQLAPRSARGSPSSRFLSLPPTSICLSCQYNSASSRRQLRFSSSSSSNSKPPSDGNDAKQSGEKQSDEKQNDEKGPAGQNDSPESSSPSFPSLSSSSSSSFPPFTIPLPQDPQASQQEQQPPPQPPPPPPPPPPSPPPSQEEKQSSSRSAPKLDLPSALNARRSAFIHSLSAFMDRTQATLFSASRHLNDLTGYSSIEMLKSQITTLVSSLNEAQARLHASRNAYKSSVAERSATQREVTTLLARQKTWTPGDFERFTTLYRQDYHLDAGVAQAAQELEEAEAEVERLGRELSAGILERYHEEQIWSDKIRRMSTWGTWGLMGVNILLFLALQFGAEPWRRQRLVKGFEEKVREALAEEREKERVIKTKERESEREWIEAINIRMGSVPVPAMGDAVGSEQAGVSAAAAGPVPAAEPSFETPAEPPISPFSGLSWREVLTDPKWWKSVYAELSSERRVAVRMRDVSIIALEGVAAGVTIAGAVAVFFVRLTRN